jgi:hypothetical protein
MQIDRTGLKPLAYGHPVNSPPSCEPPQHPKRMQLWVHVRRSAPLRGPVRR